LAIEEQKRRKHMEKKLACEKRVTHDALEKCRRAQEREGCH
jgi:hypothetical protein